MAYSIRIDPPARLGVVTYSDRVNGHDLMASIAALYGHPDWVPGFDMIWDASTISLLVLDPIDIERIVAEAAKWADSRGAGRTAIIVNRDIDATITRLFLYRHEPGQRERRVFDRLERAMAWLREDEKPGAGTHENGVA